MEWPIAIVVGSVAMGAVLGLVAPGRGRLLDAIRTFAIVSAVAVVVGRLIPDAISAAGPLRALLGPLGLPSPLPCAKPRLRTRSP